MRAGYGWSFPARDEVRIGVGSFDPRDHVKEPTVRLTEDLGSEPLGYQGNWIPHALRPATEDGVFFVGDSAGHCLPLSAEGIRTAFYFGIAAGRELAAVLGGSQSHEEALRRYGAFSAAHGWKFAWMKRWQDNVWRLRPRPRDALVGSLRLAAARRSGRSGTTCGSRRRSSRCRRRRSPWRRRRPSWPPRWSFGWAPCGRARCRRGPAAAAAMPARRMAIVACMDARLDPLRALGLQLGDAHVIRNAGAVVTDDVLHSLEASRELAGTTAVDDLAHSDCRAHGGDDEVARAVVRNGVGRVREALPGVDVSGAFYDLATGRVSGCERAASQAPTCRSPRASSASPPSSARSRGWCRRSGGADVDAGLAQLLHERLALVAQDVELRGQHVGGREPVEVVGAQRRGVGLEAVGAVEVEVPVALEAGGGEAVALLEVAHRRRVEAGVGDGVDQRHRRRPGRAAGARPRSRGCRRRCRPRPRRGRVAAPRVAATQSSSAAGNGCSGASR